VPIYLTTTTVLVGGSRVILIGHTTRQIAGWTDLIFLQQQGSPPPPSQLTDVTRALGLTANSLCGSIHDVDGRQKMYGRNSATRRRLCARISVSPGRKRKAENVQALFCTGLYEERRGRYLRLEEVLLYLD